MATGDVVNTAARLQSAAPVDGVLVDETTYRATDRAIRYAPVDPVHAKGKADPSRCGKRLSRALRPEQSRVDDLPLVGREREVAQLGATMERSRHEPSAQLVTVVGAPGIGKTRLVQGVARPGGAGPRDRHLAAGSLACLWRGGRVLGARGDGEGGSRGVGVGLGRDHRRQVRRRCRRRDGRAERSGLGGSSPPRSSALRHPARRRPRAAGWRRSRHGGDSLSRWLNIARRCWYSRICTGPTMLCWTSSTCSPIGQARYRS